MPKPSDASPRPPTDFASFLATSEPVLLVGGQAVNLWALFYEDRTRELAPFVSRDVDVLGDLETLKVLGKLAGTKPQIFPMRPPTNEVGVVIATDANGQPLLIEVLRSVHGVSNDELRETVYTMALGKTQVQVPGPIALLKAKIANVADLAQTGRQDGRHVMILGRIIPAYLSDLQMSVKNHRLEERRLIDFLERLLAIISAKSSRRVFDDLRLDGRHLFQGLGDPKLMRLDAFLTKRLPRMLRG